jgi:PAS domain S-box-containing protein
LIVDDAPSNLCLLSQMLTQHGYKVRAVVSGERALEVVQMSPPDLILLDIMMPGMSGYEVCERLKADEQARDIPIIFISALDATEDKVRAFTAGGVDYVTKPFHSEEVLARVETHLALRDLNATLKAQVIARTAEIITEKGKSETILRSVGDGIAMTDLEARIQHVNKAFTTLTGYTVQEAIGQPMHTLLLAEQLPEQDRWSVQFALGRREDWQGEIVVRRKDGRTYDAAMTVALVRDAEGQLVGYITSHQDIGRLKNLDRARNQFISNVSHQLRTPVATLRLYAHLMRQAELSEENRQRLQMMENEIARLTHLVQDILEITNLGSGRAVAAWKPISLPTVIEKVVVRYQDRAETAGLTLVVESLPSDLPLVEGDQARLAQALGEIVENAVTFVPSGGRVTVRAGTAEDKGRTWVTIAVRDTGPGIPPEEQERVFDRFFRGSLVESDHVRGTGLGLNIAQEIVRAHGGRITLESQVGSGSTFTVWLPSAE